MKPLPDIDDVLAMAERGRRSALHSARAEVLAGIRDTFSYMQSADIADLDKYAKEFEKYIKRLNEISELWGRL